LSHSRRIGARGRKPARKRKQISRLFFVDTSGIAMRQRPVPCGERSRGGLPIFASLRRSALSTAHRRHT
jgi:hypothetical protein